jgi:signal transduction histidine kinase
MEERERAELTAQILRVEQDERRRIALFLHDGPVQSLSGIALMLDAALSFVEQGRVADARAVLEKALDRHRLTIGELRDLSFNLEPVVLRDHGLAVAVQALAEQHAAEHGIVVEVELADADRLGEQTQAALYEIVRESLEGAIRRGPPARFSVLLAETDGLFEMTIDDDAPGERRRRSVEVLQERARTLGARLSIRSEERGTRLVLAMPDYSTTQ